MKIELSTIQAEIIIDALEAEKKRLDSQKQLLKEFKCVSDFMDYEIQAHNDLVKMIRRN